MLETSSRIAELQRVQREAAHQYYILDTPIMDDQSYDAIIRELVALGADDPTEKVAHGAAFPGADVEHIVPMLSLQNTYGDDPNTLLGFLEGFPAGTEFMVDPKLDGLAVCVEYEAGRLIRASTRGDGYKGEDITLNAMRAKGIPRKIEGYPGKVEIRGEMVITRNDFISLSIERAHEGLEPYANRRNGAAGAMRNQSEPQWAKHCSFIAYDIVGEGVSGSRFQSLKSLEASGIIMADACDDQGIGPTPDLSEIIRRVGAFDEFRATSRVDMDGAVIKADSYTVCKTYGARSSSPRWATAWKYKEEAVVTTLNSIEVQVGRTGRLTPVAYLEPVSVGGVVVSFATLHNQDYIDGLGLYPGATVTVQRAKDVIPQVTSMISPTYCTYQMPDTCPSCGTDVDKSEIVWRCPNKDCNPISLLSYVASRSVLDIDGLSIGRLEQLAAAGVEMSPWTSLFGWTEEDLLVLGPNVSKSLHAEIRRVGEELSLYSAIVCMGVRKIGHGQANLLVDHFDSLEELSEATLDQLLEVEGFGPGRSEAVMSNSQLYLDTAEQLASYGITPTPYVQSEPTADQDYADDVVVVTGKIEGWTRGEAEAWFAERGAKISGSVSGSTTLVVVGERAGSKAAKAAELGTPQISADEFLKKVENAEGIAKENK